jgi:hypothetical protein
MLTIALALTLSTLHHPQPSALHLIESQGDAPRVTASDGKHARLIEIDDLISRIDTTWSPGSVALTAVGLGGAGFFALGGFLIGALVGGGGIGSIFIIIVGLATGALCLLFGIGGLIWGATHAGANQARLQQLRDERQRLLTRDADTGVQRFERPTLTTVATF